MGAPLVSNENLPRGCDTICRDGHSPRSVSINSASDVFSCITVHLGGGPLSSVLMGPGDWHSCHDYRRTSRCLRRTLPPRSLSRIRGIRAGDQGDRSLPFLTSAVGE